VPPQGPLRLRAASTYEKEACPYWILMMKMLDAEFRSILQNHAVVSFTFAPTVSFATCHDGPASLFRVSG
jgi:hypothetical protein